MSTKKKLLTALIVFIVSVVSRALCLLVTYYSPSSDEIVFLPVIASAIMYAAFYDKLVFCGRRFISALVHLAIWLTIDVIYILSIDKVEKIIYAEDNNPSAATFLQIGLCFWVGFFVLSLFFISLKRSIKKSNEKAEKEQMIKEIMQRNTESNFKEKNDV